MGSTVTSILANRAPPTQQKLRQLLRKYNPFFETRPLSTPKPWLAACLWPRVPHLDNKPRHRGAPNFHSAALRLGHIWQEARRNRQHRQHVSQTEWEPPPVRRGRDSTHLPAAVRAWARLSCILAGWWTRVETANLVRVRLQSRPAVAAGSAGATGAQLRLRTPAAPARIRRPAPPVRNTRYLSLCPP